MNQLQQKPTTISNYIEAFPLNVQVILEKIRTLIQKVAPEATESIGYGIPTFKLNGNLVHFAAYKNHIGFYPGAEAIQVFKDKLRDYETSKGTIQFPLDKEIPLKLIQEITEYRVSKNQR